MFLFRDDIAPIHLDGNIRWNVGKEGFLTIIDGVIKEGKSQGLSKAMFLGDVLPVDRVSGVLMFFLSHHLVLLYNEI